MTVSFCLVDSCSDRMVGMGTNATAKSDAMFSTACASATFIRHDKVPSFNGLHGPPVMLVSTAV